MRFRRRPGRPCRSSGAEVRIPQSARNDPTAGQPPAPRVIGTTLAAVLVCVLLLFLAGAGIAIHRSLEHLEAARADGAEDVRALTVALAAQVLLTVGAFTAMAGAFLYVQRRVLGPLSRITRAMHRLARGDATVEVPETGRADEIGAMARAVDVFKRNALDLRAGETERARLEERVLTLLAAVEHSPVPMLITDRHGVIEYINPKFSEASGWTPDEVLGKTPSMFKSGHTPPDVYRDMWKTIRAGKEWRGEFYNRRKSGECYWENTSIAPVLAADGSIRHFIAVKEDITERKDAERRAWQRAHFDPLTELPNRVLFEDRLNQAIARANRSGKLLALLFLDLDLFKGVNDTYGHEAGDELLQAVAYRLRACVREYDTVSRLGGDEFVVLLTDLACDEEAGEVARRIINAVGQPFELEAATVTIGVSIGIAIFPRDGQAAAALMKHADTAMYRSKGQGRNVYRFFSTDPVAYLDGL
ncbi:diguanylate cyclase domain-containing protein [Azospirillum halopraeferens]|uniref:diguanylate cyclase domain-containing protein n=1 Tax=Azospirillum halopraeferens TaxID=34010 RepID=UPI00040F3943|nr:diguanylate cyclase [Azospirillum halopraeferens]